MNSAFEFKLDINAALSNHLGGTGVRSGIYLIKIEAVPFEIKNGNPVASLNGVTIEKVEIENESIKKTAHAGKNVTVFNLALTPTDTNGNERFSYAQTMELLALAGVRTGQRVQKMVGKKTQKMMEVFVEAENKEVIVAIKGIKDVWEGKERYNLRLLKTFSASGQSLAELQREAQTKQVEPAKEILALGEIEDGETDAYKNWVAAGKPTSAENAASSVAASMPEIPGVGEMPTFGQVPAQTEAPTTQAGGVNLFG